MARVTIEDCVKKIRSPFKIALVAALYTRLYLMKGQFAASTEAKSGNKPPVCALRAIAEGRVGLEMLDKISS